MNPAKQCYHCQGLGHVQADCPTLRLSGGPGNGRCYSCGQAGHLAVRDSYVFKGCLMLTLSSATAPPRALHQSHRSRQSPLVVYPPLVAASAVATPAFRTTAPLSATSAAALTTSPATARLRP